MPSPYDDFWTASQLTPLAQRRFAERLRDYDSREPAPDPFEPPGGYYALRLPNDGLHRVFLRRRSEREFADRPLSARELGAVLEPLADAGGAGRSYPSAGGLRPLRCYPLLLRVQHPLSGRVCRYDPERHALQDVGPCPGWDELGHLLAATGADGAPEPPGPQFVLVFVLADQPMLAKFGMRGGRFGLFEAGCAVQSVAIRAAAEHLGGYLLGGAADEAMLGLVGLAGEPVRVAAVYAGGIPS